MSTKTLRKVVRNCLAVYVSQAGLPNHEHVYFQLAFSDKHVWDMPLVEWEALPDAE